MRKFIELGAICARGSYNTAPASTSQDRTLKFFQAGFAKTMATVYNKLNKEHQPFLQGRIPLLSDKEFTSLHQIVKSSLSGDPEISTLRAELGIRDLFVARKPGFGPNVAAFEGTRSPVGGVPYIMLDMPEGTERVAI